MLKVYFTASTSFDGQFRGFYKRIIRIIEKHSVGESPDLPLLISGYQIVNPSLLKQDKKLTKKQIFQREKDLIEEADCIIAEVTKPSLGVGGEIVYALIKDKPVLALVSDNQEDLLSPMIAGNPSENLFLEYYNSDKLPFVINDFLTHVETIKSKNGKLIVIDGGDGSGKTTQAMLLVEYLKKNKYPTKYIDFPQYYNSFHGKTVAKFLRGEFGDIDKVSPYLAALAYAVDRASTKNMVDEFLKKGGYIVSNRYATSSMAHQGAKFTDEKERKEFLKWIYELEYKIHRIPKEDIVIFLYVPWQTGIRLSEHKKDRRYLKGKSDIAEKDVQHRISTEKLYRQLAQQFKHWVTINCVSGKNILKPEEIHKRIVQVLTDKKILRQI